MKRLMSCLVVISLLAVWSAPAAAEAQVTAKTETVAIPTFALEPNDPEPAIFEDSDWYSAYPRSFFRIDTRSDEPVDKDYTLFILENEHLRVEVLPEVGGRIWRIIDKADDRNLLWTNDCVKPIRVGRRRGWIAGGIEFPFPVGNHGEDTMEPWRSAITRNEDGSASIVVGTFDHYYRFWSSYEITLAPGEKRFSITPRLYNPTDVRNRYQLWINAALDARDDLQFIFPVEYVTGHGFDGVFDWPNFDEKHPELDISYWKNREDSLGVFGWDADYMGAFFHDDNIGLLRYSQHEFTRGIKLWTWGTDSHWVGEYSLEKGAYVEIQGGRWPTQEMHGWLAPRQMDTWTEWWYPVSGTGGVDAATSRAAMTLKLSAQEADARIDVLTPVAGTLRMEAKGETLFAKEVSADAGSLLEANAEISALSDGDTLSVTLTDREGFVVIAQSVTLGAEKGPKPEVPSTVELEGDGDEWKALGKALELDLNEGNINKARESGESLVVREPEFAAAWKTLGILALRQYDYARAAEALTKAVELAGEDAEARYYLGVAKLRLGSDDALETLSAVKGDMRFEHAAMFARGRAALKSGDTTAAVELFDAAGAGWSNDALLWGYLAVAQRVAGNETAARAALERAFAADPLNPFAAVEKLCAEDTSSSAGGFIPLRQDDITRTVGSDWDLYLEVALQYAAVSRFDEALDVAQAGKGFADNGLYHYYLAWFAGLAGKEELAKSYVEVALARGKDFVFPHREEAVDALEYAGTLVADGRWPAYHESVMTYWLGRHDEATAAWEELIEEGGLPGLHRMIATNYSKGKLRRIAREAMQHYERAVEEEPDDTRSYYALDDLYESLEEYGARDRLLEKARERFPEDDEVALRLAIFYCDSRDHSHEEALAVLESHTFHRSHQSRHLNQLGRRALWDTYTGLASEALAGDRDNGIEPDEEKAFEYFKKTARIRETLREWFD